jgi:DNA mismatch repair protein MutS
MAKSDEVKLTPLMAQYFSLKKKHDNAILLFRVGDFYETFGEDAVLASSILNIVLTSRNNGGSDIELAGFPYHSLDTYLPKLVKAGQRVAVCEQLEKPSKEKKIVERGVTQIITPGLVQDEPLLFGKSNNWLCSLYFSSENNIGIAFLDISTGEFLVEEGNTGYIEKLINDFRPSEILYPSKQKSWLASFSWNVHSSYKLDDWVYTFEYAREKLLEKFGTLTLKGFGIEELPAAQVASGALLHYLILTENKNNDHVSTIQKIDKENILWLDKFTIRNLEIIDSLGENGLSLLSILDKTQSPMGARMLKKWLLMPLKTLAPLQERQQLVSYFHKNFDTSEQLSTGLKQLGDIERLATKISTLKINPRELYQVGKSLTQLKEIKTLLTQTGHPIIRSRADSIESLDTLQNLIFESLQEEPPVNVSKGNCIKDGCNPALDEYRFLIRESQKILLEIQEKEIANTGISHLKIGYNSVFGYYLEVTNKYKNQNLIPSHWTRKQTLTNAERYISEELKDLEIKIINAEEKISELEDQLFRTLVDSCATYVHSLLANAKIIAELDCLLSFSIVAHKNNYTMPTLTMDLSLEIQQGRHPVIEQHLPLGEQYVPNDIYLDNNDQQIILITGPNMSGKSAVLRQTALICLMAQIGSFVPAESATLGLVDKIFTRVGASDNISSGESTFMVEMNETANILNNMTQRSLILLDEIGRGTSTYDGISIAWAIAEFIHEHPFASSKTLFATHYHELNQLESNFKRIKNFHISSKDLGSKIIFLRKLVPGGSEHSFGLHVAKLAGMPRLVIQRAEEILHKLAEKSVTGQQGVLKKIEKTKSTPIQMSMFAKADPRAEKIKAEIKSLDLQNLTPLDCLLKIHQWKSNLEE